MRPREAEARALHQRHGAKGLTVIALYDAALSVEQARAYAKAEGIAYPVGLAPETHRLGWDSPLFAAYRVTSLPRVFLIDRSGKVRLVDPDPALLAAKASALLREP